MNDSGELTPSSDDLDVAGSDANRGSGDRSSPSDSGNAPSGDPSTPDSASADSSGPEPARGNSPISESARAGSSPSDSSTPAPSPPGPPAPGPDEGGEPPDRPVRAVVAVLVAVFLAVLGIALATLTSLPAGLIDPDVFGSPQDADRNAVLAMIVLNFVGFFLAGAIYLAWTDRGWAYVDLALPDLRGVAWIVGATVASVAFVLVVSVITHLLDVPSTPNVIVEMVAHDRVLLYSMLLVVVLFNAPAEEFLFRNVIQKRLYVAFSRPVAVLIASVVFTVVHLPAFYAPGLIEGVIVSLIVVFVGSCILGAAYAATDNLVVPTAAHAGYNLFQFGILIVAIEFGEEEAVGAQGAAIADIAMSLPWSGIAQLIAVVPPVG